MRENSTNKKMRENDMKGQAIIEFMFCVIVVLLLFYGSVMALRWSGLSLSYRRDAHDRAIRQSVDQAYSTLTEGPYKQLSPDFYTPLPMNLIFRQWKDN